MGRPAGGWRLRERPGYPFAVRFTVSGKRHELGTGETDRDRAAAVAAELYADAVRGARRKPRRAHSRGSPIAEVAAEWLTAIASTIDPGTRSTIAMYAKAHWAKHWPTLESVTDASAADYARKRLREVQASTVRKELSALRQMLAWCVETGRLAAAPLLPSIPKRALGTKHKQARKGPALELSPAEMRRLLAALPAKGRDGYPVRARYTFQYETGLRASTIDALSVPEHWRRGQAFLELSAGLDKARFGRRVPLSPKALDALSSAVAGPGIIFGPRDSRMVIRKAAVAVLGKERGERFSQGHLRHNRLTHWAERSKNLPGIQHLAGHKQVSTTARYVKASERAALDVLRESR